MPYKVFFQISRTTNLGDWKYDPNLSEILRNGRVVAYHEDTEIFTDLEAGTFTTTDDIENEIVSHTDIDAFLYFLDKNNITSRDITRYYFVYHMNFNLSILPEGNPELN